jgi:hypothetical protein
VGTATTGEAAGFGAEVPTVDRFTPRRAAVGFGADDTGPAAAAGKLVAAVTAAAGKLVAAVTAAAGKLVAAVAAAGRGVVTGADVIPAIPAGAATRLLRSPADAADALREARAAGLRRGAAFGAA